MHSTTSSPDWFSRTALPRLNTPSMPDDHSELVPPLPIPNRTVKRLHANDSADTRVKVGNRQAPHPLHLIAVAKTPPLQGGVFAFTAQIEGVRNPYKRARARGIPLSVPCNCR